LSLDFDSRGEVIIGTPTSNCLSRGWQYILKLMLRQ
jgi:hypothetical protein